MSMVRGDKDIYQNIFCRMKRFVKNIPETITT